MPDQLLLTQRNFIFEVLRNQSLDPADFTWTQRPGDVVGWPGSDVPALERRTKPFYFAIGDSPYGGYNVAYLPGNEGRVTHATDLNWHAVKGCIVRWVFWLRDELAQTDMWSQIAGAAAPLVMISTAIDNSAFTPDELRRVEAGLAQLRSAIEQQRTLSNEQTQELLMAVTEIQAAAGRVGHKDWFLIVVGALASTMVAAAVPPDVAHTVFQLAMTALQAQVLVGSPLLSP